MFQAPRGWVRAFEMQEHVPGTGKVSMLPVPC